MRRHFSVAIVAALTVVLAVTSPASASGPDLTGFVPNFTQAIPFLAQGTSTASPVGGVTVTATTNTGVAFGGTTYLHQSNSRLQTILTFSPPIPGFKVQTRNHADCQSAAGAPPNCFEQYDFVGRDSSNTIVFQSSIRNSNETTSYVPGATINGSLTGLISTLQIDYSHDIPVSDFSRGSYLDLWLTDSSIAPATQTVTGNPGTPITATTAYTATGFAGAITYAITGGTLPDGLVLNPSTGVISGTPTSTSSGTVTITATGASFGQATATVTFSVTLNVTYDAQGGTSPAGGTRSTTAGATLASLATTTRSGYTFAGWFTAPSGGTQVTTSAGHGQTENFTLYAQWTANTLNVSYDGNGGSPPSGGASSTVTGGTMSSLPTTTRAGYMLAGWFTAPTGGSEVTTSSGHGRTSNFTLYAQWTANTLTVSTDEQGGSTIADTSTTTGASMSSPGTPTREGYAFAGWSLSPSGSTVSFPYAHGQTSDFTLYAQWTANTFTSTFDANGGLGSMSAQTASSATALTANSFTRAGYTFAGWNTAANGSGTPYADSASYPFTANETLYAQWTANTLTVTTDEQGGSAVANATTTTGASMSSPGSPTREEFVFAGWSLSPAGSTITFPYAHGQTGNFTLYAQWRRLPSFNTLSGVATPNTSFGLVASSGDFTVTLSSDTPSVCRVVGAAVVFVAPGACRVQASADGVVVHTFTAQVAGVVQAGAAARRKSDAAGTRRLDTRVVYFDPDSAVLTVATRRELRGLADELRRSGAVTVTGHAADAGDPGEDVALDLSQRRAQRVAEFLAARGINVTVETAQGKKLPVSTDRTKNRRVEIAWYVPGA